MLETGTIDPSVSAQSEYSLNDSKYLSALSSGYGLQTTCNCATPSALSPSVFDYSIGTYEDNRVDASIHDSIGFEFEQQRDREEFSRSHNQVGNYSQEIQTHDELAQIPSFSGATRHSPDDVQSSIKSEQDILDYLNQSPSSQIQGSGSKGTSSFSGVSLSGSDSVTGIDNNQGSSESDLWGRIGGSIADQHNTSPTGSDDGFSPSDGIDVIQGMMTSCTLWPFTPPLLRAACGTFGVMMELTEEYIEDRQSTGTSEHPDPQENQPNDSSSQSCQERVCPTDPDEESGIYTGPRTNPIDLSQGDVGQDNPEDGSFGPEFTVPWHSYESDRPTLLDITGQPSEGGESVRSDEKRTFSIDSVINPVPEEV